MADTLTFYTNPMSRGRIARWMLEEVGAPYETVLLEYGTTMKAPEYLAINPMGKVPAIKHGEVEPDKLNEQEALALMLANPILIRRPLMQVGDSFKAGFDQEAVAKWIGLKEIATGHNMENCTRTPAQASCSHE